MRLRATHFWYSLAAVLVLGVLALNTYRAVTQSITIDEAYTYTEFVEAPFSETLTRYDANQHILFSIAARITTALLPVSEFTLRLPTVMAGVVFLTVVCLLCARALGPTPLFAAAIGLAALDPFVLDYLSAARGYGLALAFWFTGLLMFLKGLRRPHAPGRIAAGALCAMLSVAANLTFAFPAAGLIGMTLFVLVLTRRYRLLACLILPALFIALLLYASPLRHARPAHFYHGAPTISESVNSLGAYTFFYRSENFTLAGMPNWLSGTERRVLGWLRIALAILAAGVVAAVLLGIRRRHRGMEVDELSSLIMLLGGSSMLGAILLVAAHHLFGVLYPASRTGLFWVVTASLLGPLLAGKLTSWSRYGRPAAVMLATAGLACAAYLGSQIRTGDYAEWRYDAGTKEMVRRIDALPRAAGPMRAGVTWTLASSMEYYRRVWKLDWDPVARMPVEQLEQRARASEFQCVVLLPADQYVLERIGWRPVFRDPVTQAILAVPAAAR